MTLRSKLSIVFAGFAAVLVAVFGVFVHAIGERAIQRSVSEQLAQAAEQMTGRLDRHMAARQNEIALGAAMAEVFAEGGTDARRGFMVRLQQAVPAYAWIGYAETSGRVESATGGLLEGEDVSTRPWFAEGLRAPASLDVHEAKLLQRYLASDSARPLRFVDVAAPVRDRTGRTIGVLAGHLSWSWADEVRGSVLSTIKGLAGSEILVLAKDGTVLLGPQDTVGTTVPADAPGYVSAVSQTYGYGSYAGLGWSVVVRQPVDEALAPVTRIDSAIVLVGALLLAAAALAGRFLARHVTRPLSAIAREAEAAREGGEIGINPLRGSCVEIESLSKILGGAFANLRRIQAELEESNASLEERVAVRTRQVEDAARAKGEFLATMSHEIRTPLNAILGFADIVLDEKDLPHEVERRVRMIRGAGAALKKVVDDVLDITKVEEGRIQLDLHPFDPTILVSDVACLMETLAKSNAVELTCEVDGSVGRAVHGDESHLRQILVNLVGNAVKFTAGGTVVLRASRPCAESNAILFQVVDDGIGMTPEQVGRLFSRFSQADGTIQSRFGGSGLGLAISQQLVGLMGGSIRVESEPGTGSVFSFAVDLPVVESVPCASATSEIMEGSGGILLVEDVETNREVATVMLERAGHGVVSVSSGEEAIAVLSRRSFDLVLMDIQMPGLDGRETTLAIRRMPGLEKLPVVAFTANTLPCEVAGFAAAGIDDHVAKPVDRASLLAKVAEWMPKSHGSTGPRTWHHPLPPGSFDEETNAELVEMLGPARAAKAASELICLLKTLDPLVLGNREAGRLAHRIVTVAGTLGFMEISKLCRALETACRTEDASVTDETHAVAVEAAKVRRRLDACAVATRIPCAMAA